jgi:hypothetical protein
MRKTQTKFKCEYCNKILANKYTLRTHIEKNKTCLSSRGLQVDIKKTINCNICGFNTVHHLANHLCRPEAILLYNKNKEKDIEIEKLNTVYKDEIERKDIEIEKLNIKHSEENKKLAAERDAVELENEKLISDNFNYSTQRDADVRQFENTILELKKEIEDYKKQIFSIASQPKNTTNTTNNQTNIKVDKMLVASLTEEMVKLKAEEFMQIKHIDNGVKGYADFFIEHLPGTIACTDVSRNILKYKDDKNEIQTGFATSDTGGIKTGKLFFNGISLPAMKLFTERYDYLQNLEISEEKRLEMVNVLIDNRSKMNSIVRGDVEGEKERRDWAKYVGSQCKI